MPSHPPQPRRIRQSASEPSLGAVGAQGTSSFDFKELSARPGARASPEPSAELLPSSALYAAPSYASVYVEPEDLEPGPGTYDTPCALGNQIVSHRETLPHVSMTAKHERAWAKVMITKDHLDVLKARGTPGPGAYAPQRVPSQARVRFGTSKRQPMNPSEFQAPGPVYEVRTEPDQPRENTKFGKASRFEGEAFGAALDSTGPGQYEVNSSFDGMRFGKSFGASHRAYDRVRFPGSDRVNIGRASSGPGPARPFMNDGVRMSIGRAERMPVNHAAKRAPGPGAYDNHEKTYPASRSLSCYSFGRPHARARMDWKQMRMMESSAWGMK